MRNLLLTVHLIAVAAWLGANLTQLTVMPMLERAGHATAAAWYEAAGSLARIYYTIAGTVIALTGIALVLDGPWSFADPFVSIGFAAVIVGGILGLGFFAPTSRAAVAAHRANDAAGAGRARTRINIGAAVDTGIMVVTIFAMVAKLGA